MKIYKNCLMKEKSNMNIGGKAKEFIEVENKEELRDILKEKREKNQRIFILGNGTNTLIDDKDLDISFISLKTMDKITDVGNGLVEIGAGLDFSKVIEYMQEKDYTGLENLAGIPGSIGGLVYMNGGAHGTEIFDRIDSVEIIDDKNNIFKLKKEEITHSYRNTEIKTKNWVVVGVTLKFDKGYQKDIVEKYKLKREENHPLTKHNLGSTFKNPEGYFSVKLIIESNLSGYSIGDAQISTKHPNFVINNGTATFNDILNLLKYVKKEVKNKTGINLEEEIIIIRA